MSTQGKASKSASGAAMSKYDVEVEGRLKALESTITELKKEINSHRHAAPAAKSSGDGGRVDALVEKLNSCEAFTQYFPKGADGVRRIDI
jgi:hypothetical protein|tara:strand:- start:209 stop:478 length:270 start_codon:yes stop_codon:yes gene_type:complete